MKRLQTTRTVLLVILVLFTTATLANASYDRKNSKEDQFFLRTDDIDQVALQFDLTIIRQHGSPSGNVWLVSVPEGASVEAVISAVLGSSTANDAQEIELAGLPGLNLEGAASNVTEATDFSGTVSSPCLDTYMPNVWSGLTGQAATALIQLSEAQQYGGCGEGMVIAVIDTQIDVDHPHLQNAIVPGYDFLNEGQGISAPQAEADLDIRTLAIVESSEVSLLAGVSHPVPLQNSVVLIGQADVEGEADLQSLEPYFGHGTMTAGLIRMVAPAAQIMPLVTFDSQGTGHPYDIIRAIYYAVENGADIINMSFSMDDYSYELGYALEYARNNGVIPVAATGNDGVGGYSFPASFTSTIGVASTDWSDYLTDYSNYGIATADMTAPGSELVTLFPGGGYAVGWGTSFSAPMVSGTVALIRSDNGGMNRSGHRRTREDLLMGTIYRAHLWDYVYSGGRLNSFGPVLYAQGYLH